MLRGFKSKCKERLFKSMSLVLSVLKLDQQGTVRRNDSLVTRMNTRHTSLGSCVINIVFSVSFFDYVYFSH